MEALVPGSTSNLPEDIEWPKQERAISIRGLSDRNAFNLAECCHPVPGDRIVGLRLPGEAVEVHSIDCLSLANGVDVDWLDLSWGERTTGAVGRLRVVLYNRPGTLAEVTAIFASNRANVVDLHMTQRDDPFGTYEVDLEVLPQRLPSLRAQRSNPGKLAPLDCFVASLLAMTNFEDVSQPRRAARSVSAPCARFRWPRRARTATDWS
jgi:(p)ppGpp synthase/HD superfamily hydrolase